MVYIGDDGVSLIEVNEKENIVHFILLAKTMLDCLRKILGIMVLIMEN